MTAKSQGQERKARSSRRSGPPPPERPNGAPPGSAQERATPHYNRDVEQAALAGVLLYGDANLDAGSEQARARFEQLISVVKTSSAFGGDIEGAVFDAMSELYEDDANINRVTVWEALRHRVRDLDPNYIDQLILTAAPPDAGTDKGFAAYAEQVRRDSLERRRLALPDRLRALGMRYSGDPQRLTEETNKEVMALIEDAPAPVPRFDSCWRTFSAAEQRDDPPLERFIAKPYFPSGKAMIFSGPGASMKTQLMVYFAICRACQSPWVDDHIPSQGYTVICSTEDNEDDFRRKLRAEREILSDLYDEELVAKYVHFIDLTPKDPKERLASLDKLPQPLRLIEPNGATYRPTQDVLDLAQAIERRCPEADLVVIETINKVTGGDESNAAHGILIEAGQLLSSLLPGHPTVTFIGHVSQDAARRGIFDQYSARGGGSAGDNGRSTLTMARLTKDNVDEVWPSANLTPSEMGKYVIFAHPKVNGSARHAEPIVLEIKPAAPWGAVARTADRHVRTGDDATSDAYARMVAFLRENLQHGIKTTENAYVDERDRFGFSLSARKMKNLVRNCTKAGWIKHSGETVRGGGKVFVVGPRAELSNAAARQPDDDEDDDQTDLNLEDPAISS